MKLSWTSIKISIAGAKLSHLVQKDRIWDHGSMTEQARILFYLVQKARNTKNIESLKKHVTASCYNEFKRMIDTGEIKEDSKNSPVITELAVLSVSPRKNNKPDLFTASIKGYIRREERDVFDNEEYHNQFSYQWSFVRQGDWWVLNETR
jgi:predicted lipid-binding transport protein (Tim44 family)